jgi:hypothetical protein
MPYTKPAQTNFAANLAAGEFVVRIDTTPIAPVAVRCAGFVDHNTGNIVVEAFARVVKADGTDYVDVNGQPIRSTFQTSMDRAGVAQLGGANGLKKLMLLTVIGEDVTTGAGGAPKWINALPQDVLEHASIRTNIAAALDAAATDPSTLL